MPPKEQNEYILGTDADELWRLGLQHQVWAEEAHAAWHRAEFTQGQTILDLGCGPGFATIPLGYLVGEKGSVIGIDISEGYINFLNRQVASQGILNIEAKQASFDEMDLSNGRMDGAYCRWALAWVNNVEEVVAKVRTALKPGGRFVTQEYFDWTTIRLEPELPALTKALKACFESWDAMESDISIGRRLPSILEKNGFKVISQKPLPKLATPNQLTWQWPSTFFHNYFPRLVEMGLLNNAEKDAALADFKALETMPGALFLGPIMIEVIAEKL